MADLCRPRPTACSKLLKAVEMLGLSRYVEMVEAVEPDPRISGVSTKPYVIYVSPPDASSDERFIVTVIHELGHIALWERDPFATALHEALSEMFNGWRDDLYDYPGTRLAEEVVAETYAFLAAFLLGDAGITAALADLGRHHVPKAPTILALQVLCGLASAHPLINSGSPSRSRDNRDPLRRAQPAPRAGLGLAGRAGRGGGGGR